MNKLLCISAAVGLSLSASAASAMEWSGTAALTSDYLVDGVTQTGNDPALQVGIGSGLENGLYFGVWASQVDFETQSTVETDWYIGFAGGGEKVSYDIGAIRYVYLDHGDGFDFVEYQAAITVADTTLKVLHSSNYAGSGIRSDRVNLKHKFAVNDSWGIPLEVGHNFFAEPFDFGAAVSDSYSYVKLGLGYTVNDWYIEGSYNATDLDAAYPGADKDAIAANGKFVLMVTYNFTLGNSAEAK
jgi:uncharacterized protein (TIGR02001 family)